MNLATYFGGKDVTATQINIRSEETLQAIQDHFECSTTLAAEQELILDCVQLDTIEDRHRLRTILKAPNYVSIPTEGYLVFWME